MPPMYPGSIAGCTYPYYPGILVGIPASLLYYPGILVGIPASLPCSQYTPLGTPWYSTTLLGAYSVSAQCVVSP